MIIAFFERMITNNNVLVTFNPFSYLLDIVAILGSLTLEDMSQISNNIAVHEYLKFTVFWSYIKKKQWNFFTALFEPKKNTHNNSNNNNNNNNNKNSQQDGASTNKAFVTMKEWLAAAEAISREKGVRLRLIRTQDEHDALSNPALLLNPASSETSKEMFITSTNAAKVFLSRTSFERECYMSRKLAVGTIDTMLIIFSIKRDYYLYYYFIDSIIITLLS